MSSTKRIDPQSFKPFKNFIQSIPNEHTWNVDVNKRIKFINEHLIPYRAVWDCYIIDGKITGRTDLIFENEEYYTWFILRWS
jgi:hypothetical protein